MKILFFFFLVPFLGAKNNPDQVSFSGTIKYELNYHIPEQGKRAMEKAGFAVTNGMEIEGNGSGLNIKILSNKGVKMEVLYTPDLSFYVDRMNRKAYKMDNKKNEASLQGKPTVTKTDEFETILGRKCRKYIIERDGGAKQYVWACADYKTAFGIYEHVSGNGLVDESYAKEIDGIPLKISSDSENNGFEMKAVNIVDQKPENTEFTLPSDFIILPYSPIAVGKMMMGEQ